MGGCVRLLDAAERARRHAESSQRSRTGTGCPAGRVAKVNAETLDKATTLESNTSHWP
jgi:hypothetical protein